MSRGRAPPAPKIFGAHREGPAVASAILESGGPGDRSVLLFRILPKPGCWHRQVIVSTGYCAPSRKTRSEAHTSELQSLLRTQYAVFRLKQKRASTQSSEAPQYAT